MSYQRLTRNAASVGSYSSLWLGDGHLMIVSSSGYHESYARIELADLKGVFLVPSERRMGWGIAWGLLALAFGVVAVVTAVGGSAPVFSGCFLLLSLGAGIWNHQLGPGCRAFAVTGVQTAKLPALVRRNKARRVLARLQPLIEQAQAGLAVPPPMTRPPEPPPPAAVPLVTESAPPPAP